MANQDASRLRMMTSIIPSLSASSLARTRNYKALRSLQTLLDLPTLNQSLHHDMSSLLVLLLLQEHCSVSHRSSNSTAIPITPQPSPNGVTTFKILSLSHLASLIGEPSATPLIHHLLVGDQVVVFSPPALHHIAVSIATVFARCLPRTCFSLAESQNYLPPYHSNVLVCDEGTDVPLDQRANIAVVTVGWNGECVVNAHVPHKSATSQCAHQMQTLAQHSIELFAQLLMLDNGTIQSAHETSLSAMPEPDVATSESMPLREVFEDGSLFPDYFSASGSSFPSLTISSTVAHMLSNAQYQGFESQDEIPRIVALEDHCLRVIVDEWVAKAQAFVEVTRATRILGLPEHKLRHHIVRCMSTLGVSHEGDLDVLRFWSTGMWRISRSSKAHPLETRHVG
eukprot:c15053_g1_i2.p1 GENE.c15053_g1_i2~~c15053_g1_i2.p1  ORF type:complete len:397 (-),score=45.83 c15053_g1_i2:25-1215(-)